MYYKFYNWKEEKGKEGTNVFVDTNQIERV